jgi:hypothetical protein
MRTKNPKLATFEQAHRHEEAVKYVVKDGKGKEGTERYKAENKGTMAYVKCENECSLRRG